MKQQNAGCTPLECNRHIILMRLPLRTKDIANRDETYFTVTFIEAECEAYSGA